MAANERAIDRVIPENIGGYPVNYGFVPQTVSYDGDPFDILVLGPPIEGGSLVRGAIVGLLLMNDEKGYDAKVIVSPLKKRAAGICADRARAPGDRRLLPAIQAVGTGQVLLSAWLGHGRRRAVADSDDPRLLSRVPSGHHDELPHRALTGEELMA